MELVTMLKSCQGSQDGLSSALYMEGRTYEVTESLGQVFKDAKQARPANKKEAEAFEKARAPAPEPEPLEDEEEGEEKEQGDELEEKGGMPPENKGMSAPENK